MDKNLKHSFNDMLYFKDNSQKVKINDKYICEFIYENSNIFQPFEKSPICNMWTSTAAVNILDLESNMQFPGEIHLEEHIDVKLPDNNPPYLQSMSLTKTGDDLTFTTNIVKCEILPYDI